MATIRSTPRPGPSTAVVALDILLKQHDLQPLLETKESDALYATCRTLSRYALEPAGSTQALYRHSLLLGKQVSKGAVYRGPHLAAVRIQGLRLEPLVQELGYAHVVDMCRELIWASDAYVTGQQRHKPRLLLSEYDAFVCNAVIYHAVTGLPFGACVARTRTQARTSWHEALTQATKDAAVIVTHGGVAASGAHAAVVGASKATAGAVSAAKAGLIVKAAALACVSGTLLAAGAGAAICIGRDMVNQLDKDKQIRRESWATRQQKSLLTCAATTRRHTPKSGAKEELWRLRETQGMDFTRSYYCSR